MNISVGFGQLILCAIFAFNFFRYSHEGVTRLLYFVAIRRDEDPLGFNVMQSFLGLAAVAFAVVGVLNIASGN